VECKRPGAHLGSDCVAQVERYVRETMMRKHAAMVSVLTNGSRFLVYGVLGPIHKNELADYVVLEFRRDDLRNAETQARLLSILGRTVDGGQADDARAVIEAALTSWKQSSEQRAAEQVRLREQMRKLEQRLEGSDTHRPAERTSARPAGGKGGVKWAQEYGSQETVCEWVTEILERLVPVGSRDFIYHSKLARELAKVLEQHGTDSAKSQTAQMRLETAGNMIDWMSAQWTTYLGGKDSDRMRDEPGAQVDDPAAPAWLTQFTARWTRKRTDKYLFGRRS